MKRIVLMLGITLIVTLSCKTQSQQERFNRYKSLIIGTWIAEDDTNVKLVFNSKGILKDYYENELLDTYDYTISHKCGKESDDNAWFLKTSNKNELEIRCYEIYGVNDNNDKVMSIRDMDTGKIFIYNKQQ